MGYGQPQHDSVSLTVVVVICAGLGVPVLIIILGFIYTAVKRARGQAAEAYQPIGGGIN